MRATEHTSHWVRTVGCVVALGCSGSELTFPADPLDAAGELGTEAGVGPCATVVCGGRCVDTASDPAHCGGCGRPCGGATPACLGGSCSCPTAGRCGGGECVDAASDTDHCGSCDRRCGAAELCVAGLCVCRPGTKPCGGECLDLRADFANCGACGKPSGGGQACVGGACVSGSACASGLTSCPSSSGVVCVDTETSNAHCGECGRRCDATKACVAGDCREYVAAPFCKACPCPSCSADRSTCCPPVISGSNAFCVEAKGCPTP